MEDWGKMSTKLDQQLLRVDKKRCHPGGVKRSFGEYGQISQPFGSSILGDRSNCCL